MNVARKTDTEVSAMGRIIVILDALDARARRRVLEYVGTRYPIMHEIAPRDVASEPSPTGGSERGFAIPTDEPPPPAHRK